MQFLNRKFNRPLLGFFILYLIPLLYVVKTELFFIAEPFQPTTVYTVLYHRWTQLNIILKIASDNTHLLVEFLLCRHCFVQRKCGMRKRDESEWCDRNERILNGKLLRFDCLKFMWSEFQFLLPKAMWFFLLRILC